MSVPTVASISMIVISRHAKSRLIISRRALYYDQASATFHTKVLALSSNHGA